MPKGDGSERRAFPRYTLLMRGVARIDHGDRARDIRVIASDLSLGGILLHTDLANLVAPHDRLQLLLEPLRERRKVRLAARVLWVKADLTSEFGRTSFGCAFVDTPEADVKRLLHPALEADRLRKLALPY